MAIPRIYYPQLLTTGQVVELSPAQSHQLQQVLRLTPGSELILFDQSGWQYHSRLVGFTKKQATIEVGVAEQTLTDSPLSIHLGQAVSRGERMDYTIQKSVELGVTEITPLLTKRCGVKLSPERWESRREHWQSIIIHACQQCGRHRLAQLHPPQLLTTWLNQAQGLRLMCLPPIDSAVKTTTSLAAPTAISLLIGSEGGFDPIEIQAAQAAEFQPFSLGPRVLRTETAAVVALSLLQSRWGDL